jgi:hypothetical protein
MQKPCKSKCEKRATFLKTFFNPVSSNIFTKTPPETLRKQACSRSDAGGQQKNRYLFFCRDYRGNIGF